MTIDIEPKSPEAGVYGMPNGFWPAFCVETPVAKILGCKYKDESKKRIIYEHEGYVGEWIDEATAMQMHKVLVEYIKTDGYRSHRYFSTRQNQMGYMLKFLPICGGFRCIH